MTLHLSMPRLLPVTIVLIAAVLAMKTADLARHAAAMRHDVASARMVAQADAAVPEKAPGPGTPPAAPAAAPAPAAVATSPAPSARPSPSPATPDTNLTPPLSDGERAVLVDLRQRRQELDERAAALAARESVLAATETRLEARAAELAALQTRLQELEKARQQREEAGWQGLVKTYENMKPRDAAAIFNDLQMPVLLALLDRMKEAKAAPILAAMNPDKAREVTTGLAQLRTRRETHAATAPTGG